jgi:hypothetical protein
LVLKELAFSTELVEDLLIRVRRNG